MKHYLVAVLLAAASILGYAQNGVFSPNNILKVEPIIKPSGLNSTPSINEANPEDYDQILQNAIVYIEQDDYVKSKQELNYLIHNLHESSIAHFYRGICYKREFKLDSAIYDFKKVLSSKNFQLYGDAHLEIGYVQMMNNNSAEALSSFEKAKNIMPDNAVPYYALAYYYFDKNDLTKAAKYCKKSKELDETLLENYFLLSFIDFRLARPKKVITHISAILEFDSLNLQAHLIKGIALLESGKSQTGINELKLVRDLYPDNSISRMVLAFYLFKNNYYEEGLSELTAGIKMEIKDYELNHNFYRSYDPIIFGKAVIDIEENLDSYGSNKLEAIKGVALYNEGSNKKAVIHFTKVIDSGLATHGIFQLRGLAYNKLWENKNGAHDFIKAISLNPKATEIYFLLANYYENNDDHNSVISQMTELISIEKELYYSYRMRGLSRVEIKDYIGAVQDLNIYLHYNNIDLPALKGRIECYITLGYYDEAIKDYDNIIKLFPKHNDAYIGKAELLLAQSDSISALHVLDSMINYGWASAQSYNIRGVLKHDMQDYQGAIDDFTKALAIDKYHYAIMLNRGTLYYKIGEYGSALYDFNTILNARSEDPSTLYHRGRTLIKLGRVQEAKIDLKKAAKLGVTKAEEELEKLKGR